jgi:hypothetical protein
MFGFKNPGFGNILAGISAAAGDLGNPGQNRLAGLLQDMEAQKERAAREAELNALLGGLNLGGQGGGATGGPGGQGGGSMSPAILARLSLLNPALANTLTSIRGQDQANIDIDSTSGEAYNQKDPSVAGRRFDRSQYINGFKVDPFDKAGPNFLPEIPKGAMPDGRGGVMNIPRLPQVMGEQEAAVSRGRAMGSAPYDFISVPTPTGAPRTLSKANAVGGDFGGQSPADALAAKTRAEAATEAQLGMGQTVQQAQEALGLIESIRTNPALGARTGLMGTLPAIPGTPGADFDAMAEQLKGKVFMTAFQSLKGAGAITEQEGRAATVAIARLSRAQSSEGYTKALGDLERVIKSGVARTQQRAATPSSANPPRSAVEAELRRRGLIR